MNLKNLANKKIALLGLGVENYALLNYCLKHKVVASFTVCDMHSVEELADKFKILNKHANIFWQLGLDYNQNLDRYDIVFRSPGYPLAHPSLVTAQKKQPKLIVTSPMRLFMDLCPTKNIIGVTGTKGKGTTSSLIYTILKTAKKSVYLGGNIGIAPFDFLPKLTKNSFVILELSSFQLEDFHSSPHIAVFTNFTPEHLAPADQNNPNFHKNLKVYREAKLNIARFQNKNDFFVVNDKMSLAIAKKDSVASDFQARIIYFTKSDWPSRLPGDHNKENIAAAEVVAQILKISPEIVARAVKKFKGLEHRLELVLAKNNIKYYDDSFATTPEATITALKSFASPIILLAGGADKGANFKVLAKEITKRVKFVILFDGQATPRLKKDLLAAGFDSKKIKLAKSMPEAVRLADGQALAGDIILMSTACASFGLFKNYKERGKLFKQAIT
jgi:UDP-N-acetylmuramoylalanine--D-glutamate ligase